LANEKFEEEDLNEIVPERRRWEQRQVLTMGFSGTIDFGFFSCADVSSRYLHSEYVQSSSKTFDVVQALSLIWRRWCLLRPAQSVRHRGKLEELLTGLR
jgi:hypothetical protein